MEWDPGADGTYANPKLKNQSACLIRNQSSTIQCIRLWLPDWPALIQCVHRIHFQMDFWPTLYTTTSQMNVNRMSECTVCIFKFIRTRRRLPFCIALYMLPIRAFITQMKMNGFVLFCHWKSPHCADASYHIECSIYKTTLVLQNRMHSQFDQWCVILPCESEWNWRSMRRFSSQFEISSFFFCWRLCDSDRQFDMLMLANWIIEELPSIHWIWWQKSYKTKIFRTASMSHV